MFKTRILIFVSVLAVALLPIQSSAQYDYYYSWSIDRWDALIEVHEDASLTVKETITVDYDIEKRGIIRSIPVIYEDQYGNKVRTVLDVQSVTRDGREEKYEVSRHGPNKDIKIGDASVYIDGPHVYQIVYSVKRAMLYFDDFDEIYWNVTGDAYSTEVPITYATAVVRLPDGTEPLQYQCYTGYFGSTEQNCSAQVNENEVGFLAHDFMTVAVGFEKGIIHEPSWWERFLWFLDSNKGAALPLGILIVLFLIWLKHGNDPRMKKTVIAEFEPPGDLWPAYAGFMLKDKVHNRLIASMIIQLAVKGYMEIEVDASKSPKTAHKNATLIKKKDGDDLDAPHKTLFEAIFSGKTKVQVKKLRGKIAASKMKRIRDGIRQHLEGLEYYHKPSFVWQSGLSVAAVVIGVILFYTGAMMPPLTLITFIVTLVGCAFFAFFMPKKTHLGVEVLRQVLGFKLFMHTAERYRSKWQENKGIFAEYLPYAIAFNDVKAWAKAFEGIEDIETPNWYQTNVSSYALTSFANDISSIGTTFAANAVPRSSGSSGSSGFSGGGGGGFSGGGFGGGGTSSW